MKEKKGKVHYLIIIALIGFAALFLFSPASAVNTRTCAPCHNDGRSLSFDILEGNSGNIIPTSLNVGQTAAVSVVVSNTKSPSSLSTARTTLSGVSLSLASQNGHFSVSPPTYTVGTLAPGTASATWTITGVSAGSDLLVISGTGSLSHAGLSFTDTYSPAPAINVAGGAPVTYILTVSMTGSGTVTRSPDLASYSAGSTVQLMATPAAGWFFAGWSGDVTGTANPTSVTMNGNRVVTATFTQDPPTPPPSGNFTLTINTSGQGTVTLSPAANSYSEGTVVQVTATPAVGWYFVGWCGDLTGTTNPATIIMDANKTIITLFTQNSPPPGTRTHDFITVYEGTSTCLSCHRSQAEDMFGAVHYQWTGPTPNVPNIDGNSGKADTAFNTYCGTVVSSMTAACWSCHAGLGSKPTATMTEEQLQNIDCLICHQSEYRRMPGPPFENVTYTDYTGTTRTWRVPAEDLNGGINYVANEAAMTISLLDAARTVHLPTRETCLTCHAYAAGSDCGKRGDISSGMVNPPLEADVHMSPAGANMTCQSCHESFNHHILGRGLDIRENDRPEQMTCLSGGCHTSSPHTTARLNAHTSRVACQTCHIASYAKLIPTEMERDWLNPFWFQGLFSGQGGYKPEEIRLMHVTPTYAWYNGTSYVYALGQTLTQRPDGAYEMGAPYGSVDDGQIYPMKEHTSNSAMHDATGALIPWATSTYFFTGDYDAAVNEGMNYAGLTGSWSLVDVHTFQTLNHQVDPTGNALTCGDCHTENSGGLPTNMNLQSLGYTLATTEAVTCSRCHGRETYSTVSSVHTRHVTNEGLDCSNCHTFTRPERALMSVYTPNLQPSAGSGTSGPLVPPVTGTSDFGIEALGLLPYAVIGVAVLAVVGFFVWLAMRRR